MKQDERIEFYKRHDARIAKLVEQFDSQIKYFPMLCDHPDWTDEQCIEFAKKWHAVVSERIQRGDPQWNEGIPYCRNIIKDS